MTKTIIAFIIVLFLGSILAFSLVFVHLRGELISLRKELVSLRKEPIHLRDLLREELIHLRVELVFLRVELVSLREELVSLREEPIKEEVIIEEPIKEEVIIEEPIKEEVIIEEPIIEEEEITALQRDRQEYKRDPFFPPLVEVEVEEIEPPPFVPPLKGISWGGERPMAVVGRRIVKEGDMVEGYKVVRIEKEGVILMKGGEKLILILKEE